MAYVEAGLIALWFQIQSKKISGPPKSRVVESQQAKTYFP